MVNSRRFAAGLLLFCGALADGICCTGTPSLQSAGGPSAIVLDPRSERAVFVRVPAVGGGWRLRLPESVYADPMTALIEWNETDVVSDWRPDPGGGVRCEVTTHTGIAYAASVRPAGDDVLALSLRVTNTGTVARVNVAAHVCLSHDYGEHAETFADPDHERTYVARNGAVTCLRAFQTRVRAQYLVKGARRIPMLGAGILGDFWGPLAPEVVDLPLIVGVSASGRHAVAMAWGMASEVLQNGDRTNRCVHVNPSFGDLAPGGSREVRGRLYFGGGDPEALVRRMRADLENDLK